MAETAVIAPDNPERTAEICESVDAMLDALRDSHHEPPRKRSRSAAADAGSRRGRPQRQVTRAKLSQIQFDAHRARALAQTDLAPLRRVRLERGLTLDQAAKRALVSPRTFRRAEQEPDRVSAASWARIAHSLKLPPSALLPAG